jgi:hypothetical protein
VRRRLKEPHYDARDHARQDFICGRNRLEHAP